VGSGPASSFYDRWNELIDLSEIKFINRGEYLRVEDEHGNYIRVFSNIERQEHEFLLHAPEDEDQIRMFTHALRCLATFDIETPVSFRNFSGNWNGSFEGWLMTPETGLKHQAFPSIVGMLMSRKIISGWTTFCSSMYRAS
jgi:hypothetical protein